jgi:hypothetical protein
VADWKFVRQEKQSLPCGVRFDLVNAAIGMPLAECHGLNMLEVVRNRRIFCLDD